MFVVCLRLGPPFSPSELVLVNFGTRHLLISHNYPNSKWRSMKAPGDECHRYLSKTLSSHLLIFILRHLSKSHVSLILPYLDAVLPVFKCRDALRMAAWPCKEWPWKRVDCFRFIAAHGSFAAFECATKAATLQLGHESIHSIGSDSLQHFVRLDSRCAGENLWWLIGNHILIMVDWTQGRSQGGGGGGGGHGGHAP